MLSFGATTEKPKVDYRLRNIAVRTQWGCEKFTDTVIRAADNEFLMGAGNRLFLLDIMAEKNHPSKHVFPPVPGVVAVHAIALTNDSRFMAVSVKMDTKKDVNLIVYDLKNSRKNYQGIPKQVHYEETNVVGIPMHFSSLCFSSCNTFIAAVPTPSQYGIIIFDWQRDAIIQTIPVKTTVTKVLFNPTDSSRIVMVGSGGLFQFWRYTSKTIHAAPIVGIPKNHNITYNTCTWITDDKVVAGTECGRIILVLNCQCQMILYPFQNGMSGYTSIIPSTVTSRSPSAMNTARGSDMAVEEISYPREFRGKGAKSTAVTGGNDAPGMLGKFPSTLGGLAAVANRNMGGAADGSARPGITPALSMTDLGSDSVDGDCCGLDGSVDSGGSSDEEEELLQEDDELEASPSVVSIIVHGDIVAVAAEGGLVTVYFCKMIEAAGGHGASSTLVLLARFSLACGSHTTGLYQLHSMVWVMKSTSNYDVLCVSSTSVQTFDLKAAVDAKNMAESLATALSFKEVGTGNNNSAVGAAAPGTSATDGSPPEAEAHQLTLLPCKRLVMTYHCGKVHSLSLATRMTIMATASVDDETVRLWDYNDANGPGLLIEGYQDKTEELPGTIDVHPSGRFVAFGCDDGIREYAVTEGRYECMRRMPTKVAVTTPGGEPFMNTSSVSLVKYSHGGHLLAVVTGRLVQIYQLYVVDFSNTADDKAGCYNRLMAMTDHSANITDLNFSLDDERVFTSSVDGSVYEWNVNASTCTRRGDYIWKGACATKVVSHTHITDGRAVPSTATGATATTTATATATATGTAASGETSRSLIVKRQKTHIIAIYEFDQHQVRKDQQKNKLRKQTSRNNVGAASSLSMRQSSNNLLGGIAKGGLLIGVDSPKGGKSGGGFGSKTNSARNSLRKSGIAGSLNNITNKHIHSPIFAGASSIYSPGGGDGTSNLDSGAPSRVPSAGRKRGVGSSSASGIAEDVPSVGCYIAQWEDNISVNVKLIEVEAKITAVALARMGGHTDPLDIAVLGCSDGRVIIATFPFITLCVSVNSMGNSFLGSSGLSSSAITASASASASMSPIGSGSNSSNVNPAAAAGGSGGGISRDSEAASRDEEEASDAFIPPPLSSQTSNISKLPPGHGHRDKRTVFDISTCKVLVNHSQKISQVAVSQSGLWIFTASEEGSIFMLTTSTKAGLLFNNGGEANNKPGTPGNSALNGTAARGGGATAALMNTRSGVGTGGGIASAGEPSAVFFDNLPEYAANENLLVMTDRALLISQNARIDDLSLAIDDSNAANARSLNQLTEKKDNVIADLEATLKREIDKRDAIIMNGRDEHARHARSLNEQILEIQKQNHQNTKTLEVGYEKRLAKEQLSYQELKQYLDEFACHARLDVERAKNEVVERELNILSTQNAAVSESEAQKAKLLMYNDYVKERYTEIIDALERSQEEERHALKMQIQTQTQLVEDVQTRGRTEVNQLRRTVSLMKGEVEKKDMQLLSMQTDLDWARERIKRLEQGLNSASADLKLKIETSERWEFKSGDQQQQIIELERIRKALTSQLHTLRQELVPKEEKIVQMSEQLQEIDREYEQSLTAVSEKEMSLKQKSAKLHVLQKQVSQLRYALSRKDGSLHRAAKLFDEYKHAMQKARFDSVKQPNTSDTKGAANRITDDLLRASSAKGGGSNPSESSSGGGGGGSGGVQILSNNGDEKPALDKNGKEQLSASALAQVIGGPAAKESSASAIMKRTNSSTKEYVEVVVITDTMERSWKRMGDILEPYLKASGGMAEEDNSEVYQSELEVFEAEKQRQMLLMQRSITGLKGNIELTNLVTTNKVNGHLKDNKNLLFEVNSMRHELREVTLENQKLKAQIENMELRQKFKEEQMAREKAAVKKRAKLLAFGSSSGSQDPHDPTHAYAHQRKPPSGAQSGDHRAPLDASHGYDMADHPDDDWHHPNRLDSYGLKHKQETDVHDPHVRLRLQDPSDYAGISPEHTPTTPTGSDTVAIGGGNVGGAGVARQFEREQQQPHHPNALPHHHSSHPQGVTSAPGASSSHPHPHHHHHHAQHSEGQGQDHGNHNNINNKFVDSNFTSIQGSRRESEISLEGFDIHAKPLTAPVLPEHSRETVSGAVSPTPPVVSSYALSPSEYSSNMHSANISLDGNIDLSGLEGSVGGIGGGGGSAMGAGGDTASKASTKNHIQVAVTTNSPHTIPNPNNPMSSGASSSSYQSKLDMIDAMMQENSREIRQKSKGQHYHTMEQSGSGYTNAAAEILDKYTSKFSASGEVISNTFGPGAVTAAGSAHSRSSHDGSTAITTGVSKAGSDSQQQEGGDGNRKKATKNISLNATVKFPTINTANSFEMRHAHPTAISSSSNSNKTKNKASAATLSQSASASTIRHSNSARGLGWKRNNP